METGYYFIIAGAVLMAIGMGVFLKAVGVFGRRDVAAEGRANSAGPITINGVTRDSGQERAEAGRKLDMRQAGLGLAVDLVGVASLAYGLMLVLEVI